uniref:Telomeric repeat-binding factor 2-interacting protein 1 n=1 Tax=Astatotilapia calliptera TaxID=8154 RepID=A0A3P8Q6G2_ASTCA
MPSKRQVVAQPAFSPVLFMTVEGEPMNFFLRPGPIKRKLQPLVSAGGGMLCNVQQPGAILLTDPEDRSVIPESTAHWYVSTQYIYDCVEKNEQLNLEDYRLNPEKVQRHSARLNNSRSAYTTEEDAAILNYVSKHKTETGGNRLWQEMEKQHVTAHTWQSMKHRYKAQLAKKQTAAVEAEKPEDSKTAEEKTEVINYLDVVVTILLFLVVFFVISEVSQAFQTAAPCADLQAETQLLTAETTDAETGEPQPVSPQKQSLSGDDSTPAQPKPTPKCSSSEKTNEKQKASPVLEQPLRRTTRRQLELEPYGKKLRSSSTQAVRTTSSPQPLKKTKSALQQDTTTDQPAPKKARGKTPRAAAESDEEQSTPAAISKTIQAGIVTKALLKTSGDFSAAKDLLLNPPSISGPFWNRCDDRLLLSAEPISIQRLQEKYGEEMVAKRIVFLEVEG